MTTENQKHEFVQEEAGGNSFERSWSHQRCKRCRDAFTHYYHRETYEEAKKKAGIKEDCGL